MNVETYEELKVLMERYTGRAFIPDIDHYRRITGTRSGRCIFIECTEPIAWEDPNGQHFLCEGHYRTVRKWVEEVRSALLRPGG